jgi:hypothetical protein
MDETLFVVVLVAEVKFNQNMLLFSVSLGLVQKSSECLLEILIFSLQVEQFGWNVV